MDKRLSNLEEWGANCEEALERLCDDEEFYISMLLKFMEDKGLFRIKTDDRR